jgi:4-hydroxybutyryl-CoA dehydratase / vinylacetyl-CoA-Delta-isomerase
MQDRTETVDALWADFASPIRTAEDYINTLRGRRVNVFFMGERVPEPVEHPVIRPSISPSLSNWFNRKVE